MPWKLKFRKNFWMSFQRFVSQWSLFEKSEFGINSSTNQKCVNLRCIVVIKLVRQVHSVSKWFSLHVYKILSVFWLQKNSALLSGITGRPYSSLLGRTVLARTTSPGRGSLFPWWIEHHCMMNELTWAFVNEFFRIFRSQRVRVKNSGIEIILCCNWSAYFSRASNDSGSLFSVQIMTYSNRMHPLILFS